MDTKFSLFIPSFSKMAEIAISERHHLLSNWVDTLLVSLGAALSAVLLSIVFSAIALRSPSFERGFSPLVAISQSFPLQAIAPLLIITLGRGYVVKGFIAFLIAFFPLFVSVLSALKGAPQSLQLRCKCARAPFYRSFFLVLLPSSIPRIVGGIKIAFTLSVLGAVVAEFVAPTNGIGMLLLRAQSDYSIERIYLCILMLMIQGLIFYSVVGAAEKCALRRWM